MTKIRSNTKLYKTVLYSIYLFISYMNIQNVSSSRLYNRLQSVNGPLASALHSVSATPVCPCGANNTIRLIVFDPHGMMGRVFSASTVYLYRLRRQKDDDKTWCV